MHCFPLMLQTPEEAASIKAKVMEFIRAAQAKEESAGGAASPGVAVIDPDGERGAATTLTLWLY